MNGCARVLQRGFTLLELVAVLLVVSIASVPLLGLFSGASLGLLSDEAIQTATQLAQERAETLLAVRRNRGYTDPEVSSDLGKSGRQLQQLHPDHHHNAAGHRPMPGSGHLQTGLGPG